MFRKKRKLQKLSKYRIGNSHNFSKRKTAKNYFIKRKKKVIFSKNKNLWRIVLALGIIIIFIYWGFFSPFFKIQNIKTPDIEFQNNPLAEEIKNQLNSSLNKNLFLTNTEKLTLKILDNFPAIENVEIKKKYPKTLTITFTEYPLVANIINESEAIRKYYIINSIGYAVKEDLENPELPYIKMQSDEPINLKTIVIEQNKLKYILNSKKIFEQRFGMKIKEIIYKQIPREIHLLTERDFYIWLDLQIDFIEQFKKLKKALIKLDIHSENLEYIDLRIAGSNGDKIIYKRK